MYHVSRARNRESIASHGLDVSRMGAAPGLAGSPTAEVAGVYLVGSEFEVGFFVRFVEAETVDVWAVDGIDEAELVTGDSGFRYLPRPIPAEQVTLWRTEVPGAPDDASPGGDAYRSTLTVTWDDEPD